MPHQNRPLPVDGGQSMNRETLLTWLIAFPVCDLWFDFPLKRWENWDMAPEYFKDFDGWNIEKQRRYKESPVLYFHEREVWWCALGVNIGFEQDGKNANYGRPVVILKTFSTNACLVVPLTSREKKGLFYFDVGTVAGRLAKANLSQIRFVDKRRLINKVDTINEEVFEKLRSAIIQLNLS